MASTAASDSRSDFIKRLFAVSVSVGFATQIAKASWIETASMPSQTDIRSLILLFIAVSAVIASWEGYFASIAHKPLEKLPRFLLDIVIVFEYLILMLSSAHDTLFLSTLIVIYVTYLIWDYASILEFKERYEVAQSSIPWLAAFAVFLRGLATSRPPRAKGPSITLFWLTCLLVIFFVGERIGLWQLVANAAAVWALLLLYRFDKYYKYSVAKKLVFAAPLVALAIISSFIG